ncbi:MAG: hypothetical protein KDE47_34415, partial [Caldilineaceae bacterium]|nr:hypothetical protein [Caldilineaceae bacterium]
VNIPSGAVVQNAFIEFTADADSSQPATLLIRAEQIDSSAPFTITTANLTSRVVTLTETTWENVPAWTTGQTYQTPNLAALLQEVIDLPGWSSGNAVSFIISGIGERKAKSFDNDFNLAPVLVIEFSPP